MFVFGVTRGGLNNFVALFLAFHWPNVLVTLFNWDVGSVEGVGSSLCGTKAAGPVAGIGLADGAFLEAL